MQKYIRKAVNPWFYITQSHNNEKQQIRKPKNLAWQ